ncbi:PBP1A family penicillin-binding protein [Clostridium sp. JS66]|uniref:transglycosylase domain-containing protein n=1 Tax=Clostridium sp. JS66 TaxID=3064705 RepID=UPI00298D6151|nr:PBP1A family penicillin-binding protein [Clostridium sp. JS66]WPC41302.1 PBP1A family penicillin-binding protein [Clostridium sp. JS66]
MSKRRKKAVSKKPHSKNAFKTTLITILSLFILASVACFGVVLAIIQNAPPLDVKQILTLNEPSILYDNKNQFMDVVVTNEQRTVIKNKDIPQNLKNAFVSIEDERFYKHGGIDLKRIAGVALIDVKNKIKRQPGVQGASTITQQLLKNTLLSSEVTFKRKVQEMYLSVQLEKELSKDQILEAYMNTIYLGGRAYGVEAASEQYFNKKSKDLSLVECAFIAGMPQSPSVYYPFSTSAKKNPSVYLNRTGTVLKKMYENGYINEEQYNAAINDLNNKKLAFQPQTQISNKLNFEWYTLPAIDQIKKDLKKQYHYTDTEVQHLLMYGGLKIYTSMDRDIQANTVSAINSDSIIGASSDKNGITQPQAAAVVMDYHSGEVKAIVGGRGDQPPRSFNRAASDNYLRPSGSSIKPLTVYSPSIDSKQSTAATVIDDSALSNDLAQKYGSNGTPYYPQDEDQSFMGNMTIRTAIAKSRNLVAVKLEDLIGLKTGIEYAEKFGLTLDAHDKSSIAALSLGELHHGTNPLTMSAAYGVFGNNGNYTAPKLYTKVLDRNGKSILENKTSTRKVLSPESAYVMYDLLKGPVSPGGTGTSASFGSMPVRGKTGTSGDNKNFWFCGLTPYYSAAVWIGNDDASVCENGSSNKAAAIWSAIMQPIHENLSTTDIQMPSGVTTANICEDSGKLATSSCYGDPTGNKTYNEFFIQGTEPSQYCNYSHSGFRNNPFFNRDDSKDKNNTNNKSADTNKNNNSNTNDNTNTNNINNGTQTNNENTNTPNTNTDTNNNGHNVINPKKPTIIN